MASAGGSLKECPICCDEKNDEEFFTCITCKYSNCIDCHKTYLSQSMHEPHCMNLNCRTAIPYDYFLHKFGEKWIFGPYQEQKSNILFEHEKTLMPETVEMIATFNRIDKLETERYLLNKKTKQRVQEINDELNMIRDQNRLVGQKRKHFIAKAACPLPECKGFLNDEFLCLLCNSSICNKCFTNKNDKSSQEHVCDPEMIETYKAIKKEAKPCPSCGEFISKISGCDQMFCVSCGTAFSWITGNIDKGIIHNPHAFGFFENNHEARDRYLQLLPGNNQEGCRRTLVPPITFLNGFSDDILYFGSTERKELLLKYYQNIAEMASENNFLSLSYLRRYIREDHNNNHDLRTQYIKNEIDEKTFKSEIHEKNKRVVFKKECAQIIINTYEMCFNLFWMFHDEIYESRNIQCKFINGCILYINNISYQTKENSNQFNIIDKYFNMLIDLNTETIKNIDKLYEKFGFTNCFFKKRSQRNLKPIDENFKFNIKFYQSE